MLGVVPQARCCPPGANTSRQRIADSRATAIPRTRPSAESHTPLRVEETTDAVLRHIANASAGAVKLESTEIQVQTLLLASDTAEIRHIDSHCAFCVVTRFSNVRLSESRSSNLSAYSYDLHGRDFLPQLSSTRIGCGARMQAVILPKHSHWAGRTLA